MAIKVLVPLLGEGVEEVTVMKWLKQEGEPVQELEPLLEVNTDKVDTEIPSPASGTVLKIMLAEGTPAKVGEVLAFIGRPGEALEETAAPTSTPSPQISQGTPSGFGGTEGGPTPAPSPVSARPAREMGFISPVVAKIAAQYGVNLQDVPGTGLNGRITKNDVLAYVESPPASKTSPQISRGESRGFSGTEGGHQPPRPAPGDELIKHTVIRRQIAAHMVQSRQVAPHVLTVMETDMSRVARHLTANKEAFARDGVKLTLTAYFMMALVEALKAHPQVNSSWTEEGVLLHRPINLGMATSLGEEGLIVPVIKNAENLSLLAMARAINDLASRARAKKLQPDDVRGGTFTLTNHGISGSLFAFPIINQPQCGILGVGALQKRAVVIDDAIAIRPMVYLSFVFDHRILDGASADWFLARVKAALDNWSA